MKYYVLPYCLKTWGTSITVAPIILFLIDCFFDPNHSAIVQPSISLLLEGYFALILVGAVLSFITLLFFWGVGIVACREIANVMHRKLIMSLIGGILTALTFLFLSFALFDSIMDDFTTAIMSIYCFCVVGSSLIYSFD